MELEKIIVEQARQIAELRMQIKTLEDSVSFLSRLAECVEREEVSVN